MLPSGNDASIVFAEYFGGLLKKEAEEIEERIENELDNKEGNGS
jgi:D-alanyl-D-alanine carboxypeptidase